MFCNFDGVSQPLSKITRERLKKFLECRQKWNKLKREPVKIAGQPYKLFNDESVYLFLEKHPDNNDLGLKLNYHAK